MSIHDKFRKVFETGTTFETNPYVIYFDHPCLGPHVKDKGLFAYYSANYVSEGAKKFNYALLF